MKALCKETVVNYITERLRSGPFLVEIICDNTVIKWTHRKDCKNSFISIGEDMIIFHPEGSWTDWIFKCNIPKLSWGGNYKIPYKAKYISFLNEIFRNFFSPYTPSLDLLEFILEPNLYVGIEVRTGKLGLDYPDIAKMKDWLCGLDNPFLDSNWCKNNDVSVLFSEIPDNGIAFNITCSGKWISYHNLYEFMEKKIYEKFVRPNFVAKYFGKFNIPRVTFYGLQQRIPLGSFYCKDELLPEDL